MNASVHKLISTTALGLALFAQSVPAWAGLQFRPEVSVSANVARGSMAGARYSADGTQYIGCNFYSPAVSCSATDKTGNSLSCRAIGLHWGTAIKSITDFSHILFTMAALINSGQVRLCGNFAGARIELSDGEPDSAPSWPITTGAA